MKNKTDILSSNWINRTVEWIKSQLEDEMAFPENIITGIQVEEKNNILSGKTTIRAKDNKPEITITIFVSNNVLKKKNIEQGIKLVLIHEFCHLVDLENPDQIMRENFPEEYAMWKKAQDAQALECGVEVKWI